MQPPAGCVIGTAQLVYSQLEMAAAICHISHVTVHSVQHANGNVWSQQRPELHAMSAGLLRIVYVVMSDPNTISMQRCMAAAGWQVPQHTRVEVPGNAPLMQMSPTSVRRHMHDTSRYGST